jgi:hypothetical protein
MSLLMAFTLCKCETASPLRWYWNEEADVSSAKLDCVRAGISLQQCASLRHNVLGGFSEIETEIFTHSV